MDPDETDSIPWNIDASANRVLSKAGFVSIPPASERLRPKNRLLAALPTDVFQRIAPELTTIPIFVKQVFQTPGVLIEHVYFSMAVSGRLRRSFKTAKRWRRRR